MQYNTNVAISVSALTNKIKSLLESSFTGVFVQGEISNYKLHSSGHRYFTLKDNKSQLKAVMWRMRKLDFEPRDGMKVIAMGNLNVYPPQGSYQLDCLEMRPMGQGDLYLAFEELKSKLSQKGYFDAERKRLLPKLPFAIGISTSPTGAALQDMISTFRRRLPFTTIYFRPTLVQGDGSSQDIVKAISELENTPSEIIIIGRGGGSIEDLWSYNTEIVADAIYNCKKPVISAVGHETDFTIADFTADLRAPTPTGAAELCSPITVDELNDFFEDMSSRLLKIALNKTNSLSTGVLENFMRFAPRRLKDNINKYIQLIDSQEIQLENVMKSNIKNALNSLTRLDSHLNSLNPLSPLNKGFAALKAGENYINKNEPLRNFDKIEIIRKNDSTNVIIIKD
ncbi:MAG: exodeoxyribonuclease VII large subunit [Candidatus Kapabacteria bacterium]|nr:exodeoxyribonuclease VII large subunit [Ignavibacteriota bacterium]MCW5883461.1 exodeoxyribonuclease VII large subunit [Candidatus Kapabacteria bacterium]